jgi:hypothetical protein
MFVVQPTAHLIFNTLKVTNPFVRLLFDLFLMKNNNGLWLIVERVFNLVNRLLSNGSLSKQTDWRGNDWFASFPQKHLVLCG